MALGLEFCFIKHLDAAENPFLNKSEVFLAYQALFLQVCPSGTALLLLRLLGMCQMSRF